MSVYVFFFYVSNGCRFVVYADGLQKLETPDGIATTHMNNGDWREQLPDKTVL